ncbi:MAG TPA: LytR C-terminal domain-containing protein, partial [Solirubrobacteraceae bacterium]|nr:LytR C-terminal domain-containing protein [Solirubrobacteraceae bacterium]
SPRRVSQSRPPAPTDPPRSTPVGATVRTDAATRQAERLGAESRARRPDPRGGSPAPRRSPARATALIVGGVIVVVAVLAVVLSSGGGGKSSSQGSTGGQTAVSTAGATHTHRQPSSHHSETSSAPAAASPASTSVAVLNGTNTTGLAHGLSKALQQSGYSQATPLNGSPAGTHATTVVEYTSGHRADAQGVASALGVTQVQPMETEVASLAGAATVVVLAGADKASAAGG